MHVPLCQFWGGQGWTLANVDLLSRSGCVVVPSLFLGGWGVCVHFRAIRLAFPLGYPTSRDPAWGSLPLPSISMPAVHAGTGYQLGFSEDSGTWPCESPL